MSNFQAIAARDETEAPHAPPSVSMKVDDHERFAPRFIPDVTARVPLGSIDTTSRRRADQNREEDQWPA
jgi:hypothetical protein